MNMNNRPTIEQLRALFSAQNDDAGDHILWVDQNGTVNLSVLPDELTPVGFEEVAPNIKIRFETFGRGNKYVGVSAAQDEGFMRDTLSSLLHSWSKRSGGKDVEYVDH